MTIDSMIEQLIRLRNLGCGDVHLYQEDGSPAELCIPCNGEGQGPVEPYDEDCVSVAITAVFG